MPRFRPATLKLASKRRVGFGEFGVTAMAKARAKATGYYVSMLMTAGSFLLLAGIIAQPLLRF
jgi:hypothetical protein